MFVLRSLPFEASKAVSLQGTAAARSRVDPTSSTVLPARNLAARGLGLSQRPGWAPGVVRCHLSIVYGRETKHTGLCVLFSVLFQQVFWRHSEPLSISLGSFVRQAEEHIATEPSIQTSATTFALLASNS